MRKPRKPNRKEEIDLEETAAPAEGVATAKKPVAKSTHPEPASEESIQEEPTTSEQPASTTQEPPEASASPEPVTEEVKHEVLDLSRPDSESEPRKFPPQELSVGIIKRHTIAASAVSLVPIPGADVIGLTGLQANMIEDISKAFGHAPTKGWSLRLAGLFAVSVGFLGVGRLAMSSLLKFIPGVGSILGAGGMAAYAAATTYALGKSIVSHYEKGGNPDNLVTASLIATAKESIDEGWKFGQKHCPFAKTSPDSESKEKESVNF